mmetsp:Transcript_12651/g.14469  ORF Transcript_12651/g.14469 Transcript_12651/m.14469 type:complete len:301 (-) Transcript_12651:148-1050(-)
MPKKKKDVIIPLPSSFIPSSYDVICAQGKEAKNHSGNIYYRKLITEALDAYSQATSRMEKSQIVTDIVETVKTNAHAYAAGDDSEGHGQCNDSVGDGGYGGFIKKDRATGRYYQVGDDFAREKIGQNLRDSLSNKYKSSTKAKRTRRLAASTDLNKRVERLIQSNQFVQNKREMLHSKCMSEENTPEYFMNQLFMQTNLEILEAFKTDATLVEQFNEAEQTCSQNSCCIHKPATTILPNITINASQLATNPERILRKIERRRSSLISIGLLSGRDLRHFRRASVMESSSNSSIIQNITPV